MTLRRVRVWNVRAPTNCVAERVMTTVTPASRCTSWETTSAALYAAIEPVTPTTISLPFNVPGFFVVTGSIPYTSLVRLLLRLLAFFLALELEAFEGDLALADLFHHDVDEVPVLEVDQLLAALDQLLQALLDQHRELVAAAELLRQLIDLGVVLGHASSKLAKQLTRAGQRQDLVRGPLHGRVHHDRVVRIFLPPLPFGARQAHLHGLRALRLAALEPLPQFSHVGRRDEHVQGRQAHLPQRRRALGVDVDQHQRAARQLLLDPLLRRPVQVRVDLRPLQEAASLDLVLELLAGEEAILAAVHPA